MQKQKENKKAKISAKQKYTDNKLVYKSVVIYNVLTHSYHLRKNTKGRMQKGYLSSTQS